MIDLRSDTVTQPSSAMRKAMAEAEVGDDVLREDPTLRELEERAAHILGKEAALFTPSGTFANQLALFVWSPRGGEVYLNEESHIVQHEAGASAHISGAFLRPFVPAASPWAEWEDIGPRLRQGRDQHFPQPSLICLENALANGTVQPLESMDAIRDGAREAGIPIHLDGARIFNAAASLGVEASDIAERVDSLMFCLSKGLGAPVGSLLCGSRDFIDKAFYGRKIMGGGMRQAGVLAAAGLVALDRELPRLEEDHVRARKIAAAFMRFEDVFEVLTPQPAISMVFLRLRQGGRERNERFLALLKSHHVLTYPPENAVFRFVAHRDIGDEHMRKVEECIPRIAESLRA